MAINPDAVFGFAISGLLVAAGWRYFKNKGEKGVQVLNVIERPKEESYPRSRRGRGTRGSFRDRTPAIRTGEQSFEVADPTSKRRRVQEIDSGTIDRDEQVSTSPSQAVEQHSSDTSRVSRTRNKRQRVERL